MAASSQVAKLSIRHEAILHFLLSNPTVPRWAVAQRFGVTESWLSIITNSDAFAEARNRLTDVAFHETVLPLREKILLAADRSLDRLNELVPHCNDLDVVRKTADSVLAACGFGSGAQLPRPQAQTNIQNNFYGNASAEVVARARSLVGVGGANANAVSRMDSGAATEERQPGLGSPMALEHGDQHSRVLGGDNDGLVVGSLPPADKGRGSADGSEPQRDQLDSEGTVDLVRGVSAATGPGGTSAVGGRSPESDPGHSAAAVYDAAGRLPSVEPAASRAYTPSSRVKVELHGVDWN